jgi:hypothetical protein
MKDRIELLDIKGHLFGLISTVLTVWSWAVAVDVFGKGISAVCTLVLMLWGVKHFKSKIGVNVETKKKLEKENALLDQQVESQRLENLLKEAELKRVTS